MTPPDVAALLARHPMPWSVGALGGVYDADGACVGGFEDGPSAADLLPALATALRAALADQRRIDAVRDNAWVLEPFDVPNAGGDASTYWRVREWHMGEPESRVVVESFEEDPRAAIDAAMTADGGGV